jgi:hypothetical protein
MISPSKRRKATIWEEQAIAMFYFLAQKEDVLIK